MQTERVWNEGGVYSLQFAGGEGVVLNARDFKLNAQSCTANYA